MPAFEPSSSSDGALHNLIGRHGAQQAGFEFATSVFDIFGQFSTTLRGSPPLDDGVLIFDGKIPNRIKNVVES
ncbi:MAG TPA: hypothetical protein VHV77_06975 [Pirellulales bacterium]|jgi:hypothetical protein|nr:hypothetical protein [Pirellulales bacterium]